jgi:dTDP-4-dehydrorhamnose 3,5-epimerase
MSIVQFSPTTLPGAFRIDIEPVRDPRGLFARTFCEREFEVRGLETRFVQHSLSQTVQKGTIRGMHFQIGAASEVKVVSCSRGVILDVIIDLRKDSPMHARWEGFELSASKRNSLYIPKGFAHGFQALTDDVEVTYLISEFYSPTAAAGVRFDDPAFAISWPLAPVSMSDKDRTWSDYLGQGI